MGTRGPIPKRSDQRHGHRAKSEVTDITRVPCGSAVVPIPAPDEGWHPIARDWFASLGESGQHCWYQPSDWQTARVWAEILSRQLAASRMSAQMVSAWASAAGELLTTEGSRRRNRLELERATDVDEDDLAAVVALNHWHDAFPSVRGARGSD